MVREVVPTTINIVELASCPLAFTRAVVHLKVMAASFAARNKQTNMNRNNTRLVVHHHHAVLNTPTSVLSIHYGQTGGGNPKFSRIRGERYLGGEKVMIYHYEISFSPTPPD